MKLYLFILFALAGCSSQTPLSLEHEKFVHEKDIQPYLKEWDNNKEKLAHLSAMEEDLSLLIQALSLQTDLDTVPDSMKEQVPMVDYGAKKTKEEKNSPSVQNVIENKKTIYEVQVGRYLLFQRAESQIQKLKLQYPKLNQLISYRVDEQQKKSMTFYNVIAGPLKDQKQAKQLCLFFYKMGNKCSLAAFSQDV